MPYCRRIPKVYIKIVEIGKIDTLDTQLTHFTGLVHAL